jgi:putative ABC transport system permease protein
MHSVRYALRALRNRPAFTVPAILALGLGIGAATAIFSVVDAVLLRPLPYPQPDRLISVAVDFPSVRGQFLPSSDYFAWNRQNRVLESFAAFPHTQALAASGTEQIALVRATANFLATVKVQPYRGRDFLAEEQQPGSANVVLISYGYWQGHLAGDSHALGRNLTVDGTPYTIVGILPPDFYFPANRRVDAIAPVKADEAIDNRNQSWRTWDTLARMKPGVSIEQVRAGLAPLFAAAAAKEIVYSGHERLVVVPFLEKITGNVRLTLLALLGAVGCLLLIACTNVANLLLARATTRRCEMAVRAALGAGRAALVRLTLADSLVLALAGGVAGTGVAYGVLQFLRRLAPVDFPRITGLGMSGRMLLFTLLCSLATSLLFGLAPAWSAARAQIHDALSQDSQRATSRTTMRSVLVAAEVALSLALLVGAGLLFQSLWRLQHKNLGFEPASVLTTEISLRGTRFETAHRDAFATELRTALARIPGIEAIALSDSLPPTGGLSHIDFSREGRPLPTLQNPGETMTVRRVTPEYFAALAIPLKRGRNFTPADRDTAIVNETLVRHFFPDEDPIGRRIDLVTSPRTIIGVVADVKNDGLNNPVIPEMDAPLQMDGPVRLAGSPGARVVVRNAGSAALAAGLLRQELKRLDPRILATVNTLEQTLYEQTVRPRFNSLLFGSFAAVALLLAAIGIYGVIAFTVAARAREIGIRMALGADAWRVLRLMLRETAAPTLAGIAAGIALSIALGRYLAAMLYDIRPTDPFTYGAVAALLLLVSLCASLVPARRATRVDPVAVLRTE